jgi:release factor glutamine methyltransferase
VGGEDVNADADVPVDELAPVIRALEAAGCVAPVDEAYELLRASRDGSGALGDLVQRRAHGEPLAWITGSVMFCGVHVRVHRGVFVPRPHTEALARRAASLLPERGVALDLCTGSGAVAAVLRAARPTAEVIGVDIDPTAVACARQNGIRALLGSFDEPLPESLRGRVDVMTAVVPYVPTEALHLLPRDVLENEPRHTLDGGRCGTSSLLRAAEVAGRTLRPGGSVVLEIGAHQAITVATALQREGFGGIRIHRDEDGQDRAIEGTRRARGGHGGEADG